MKVIVVGGGLAGCAAAVRLAAEGRQVTLLERHPRLGGKAGGFRSAMAGGRWLDNGQHVATKACTALRAFFSEIGMAGAIRWQERLRIPFAAPGGKSAVLSRWDLPAPAHLLPALAGFDLLPLGERLGLKRVLDAAKAGGPETSTFLSWLTAQGQGELAVRRLWDPLVLAVCNASAAEISARTGAWVIRTGMLETADALDLGIPAVPLTEMTDPPVRRFLAGHSGGQVRTGEQVEGLIRKDGRAAGVRLRSGEELAAEGVVLAVDWAALPAILDVDLGKDLKPGAILSVILRLDREVLPEGEDCPFVGLVDQPAQWVFAKGDGILSLVFSGANILAAKPTADILGLAESSLRICLPRMEGARILDAVVMREKRATFLPAPGAEDLRPSAGAPGIPGLALAGAWTAVEGGWPATMEGAVRSGNAAAALLL